MPLICNRRSLLLQNRIDCAANAIAILRTGVTLKEASKRLGVTLSYLYRSLRDSGQANITRDIRRQRELDYLANSPHEIRRQKRMECATRVIELLHTGLTLKAASEQLGVTPQRIRQVMQASGNANVPYEIRRQKRLDCATRIIELLHTGMTMKAICKHLGVTHSYAYLCLRDSKQAPIAPIAPVTPRDPLLE